MTRSVLLSVIDRILPADTYGPSASENGVPAYLERLLQHEMRHRAAELHDGFERLDAESLAIYGRGFAALCPSEQDALLCDIEAGRAGGPWGAGAWFALLIRLTHEGYWADPSNGANPKCASWQMIGYAPRRPL